MSRRLSWRRKLALTSVAILLLVVLPAIIAEIACRVMSDAPLGSAQQNPMQMYAHNVASVQHHPILGWAPKPGVFRCDNYRSGVVTHTITADGLRSNGQPTGNSRTILALGDSYTFGDEAEDSQSWPAQLERISGARVLNGGVTGYGVDQMVIRAEMLAEQHKPDVVIVAFINHDIERCGLSKAWRLFKPWFAVRNGSLVMCETPMPTPGPRPGAWGWVVDHSYALDDVTRWYMPLHSRIYGYWETDDERADNDPTAVACLLMDRLSKLQTNGRRVMVVALATHYKSVPVAPVLDAATSHGAITLDLSTMTLPAKAGGHYTPEGNEAAAAAIAQKLGETQWN